MGGLQSKKTYEVEREEKRYSVDHRKKTSVTKKEDQHTLQLKEEVKKDILAAETRKKETNKQSTSTSNVAENKASEKLTDAVENKEKITNTLTAKNEAKPAFEKVSKSDEIVAKTIETVTNSQTNEDLSKNVTTEVKQQTEVKQPSDEEIKKEKEELLNEIKKAEAKDEKPKTTEAKTEIVEVKEEIKLVDNLAEKTAETKHVTITTPSTQTVGEENTQHQQVRHEPRKLSFKIEEKVVSDPDKICVVEEAQTKAAKVDEKTKIIEPEEKAKIEAELKAAVLGISKIEETKSENILPATDQGKPKTENKLSSDIEEISTVSEIQIIKLVEDKTEDTSNQNKLNNNKQEEEDVSKEQRQIKVVAEVQSASVEENPIVTDTKKEEKISLEKTVGEEAINQEKDKIAVGQTKLNEEVCKVKEDQAETNKAEEPSIKDEIKVKAEDKTSKEGKKINEEIGKAEIKTSEEEKKVNEKIDKTEEATNKKEREISAEMKKTEEVPNKEELKAAIEVCTSKEENQARTNKQEEINDKVEILAELPKFKEENQEKTIKNEEVVCQKTAQQEKDKEEATVEVQNKGNNAEVTVEQKQEDRAANLKQESTTEKETIQDRQNTLQTNETFEKKEAKNEEEQKCDIQKHEKFSTTALLEDKPKAEGEEKKKAELVSETKEEMETNSTQLSTEHHEPKSPSEIHPIMRKIREIEEEVKVLKEQILHFVGTTKDVGYLTLNDELIKNMIKLDDLAMENSDEIRNERKRVIKFVQECLSTLERNAEKTKIGDDSDSE